MTDQPDEDLDPAWRRLRSLRRVEENWADFARRIGISEQLVSRWRNGGSIGRDKAVELSERLDISLDWLLTGREPTVRGPNRHRIANQLQKVILWLQGTAVDWSPDSPSDAPPIPQLPGMKRLKPDSDEAAAED